MATRLASIFSAVRSPTSAPPHTLRRALPSFSYRRAHPSQPRMSSSSAASSAPPAAEKPTVAPFGSWRSPITADVVSGADRRLGGIALAGDGRLLWIEGRPEEKGRMVIVKEEDNPVDVIPQEFAARTLAQEYGGGAFAVDKSVVVFSNYKDQRLYKQTIGTGGPPVPLTPDYGAPNVSYADGVFDPHFDRYVTVMEGVQTRQDDLKACRSVPPSVLEAAKMVANVSDPLFLPDRLGLSAKAAHQRRGHGHVTLGPWPLNARPMASCPMYFCVYRDLTKRVCIAGGNRLLIESPSEPKWSPKGILLLYFSSKAFNLQENCFLLLTEGVDFGIFINGIHHLDYICHVISVCYCVQVEQTNEIVPVYSLDAEFTRPLWVFGISSYDFLGNSDHIVFSYRQQGKSHLGVLDCDSGSISLLDIPFSDLSDVVAADDYFYIEGASASIPRSIAKVTLNESKTKVVNFSIAWSSSPDLVQYRPFFSTPELVEFPTSKSGQKAYAYFYPPSNPNFQGLPDEKPPLLVKTHGGPTAETRAILDLSVQYWTSRGWAYVDVNYGGSTGYGREYRERLLNKWGIVDVDDCCGCARFLVESGKVDGQRLCITGRSAGGYTTLASLAFRDTFKAGASLYGVGDLTLLRAETHKFESHYMDNLVGNERAYYERSPINFVNQFTCPVILFQGLEDKVVPPDQARKIYSALKEKGLPVALVEYEGEQHGFRKVVASLYTYVSYFQHPRHYQPARTCDLFLDFGQAENIKFTLEQQMLFFARLVGKFEVADDITPIKIENFD
ncbi:acylaminoacyl-peptidase1 [Zea mays]|uniref:Acylaminoacyl-peptidase1 n=1 Tax=Zea mays TaxID=4577 RepID=A0A1D6NS95_MAIZE|nr:acylaminoacyl-peptidase1 [Zea mays]